MNRTEIETAYAALFKSVQHYVASGREHPPIVVMLMEGGGAEIVDMRGAPNKDTMAFVHQELAQRPDVGCAVFVMEAWVMIASDSAQNADELMEAASRGELYKCNGVSEAMTFNFLTKTEQGFASCAITRTKDGAGLTHGGLKWLSPDKDLMAGRFIREGAAEKTRH